MDAEARLRRSAKLQRGKEKEAGPAHCAAGCIGGSHAALGASWRCFMVGCSDDGSDLLYVLEDHSWVAKWHHRSLGGSFCR